MRRCQDSINPRTHPDIMVLSNEDEDPGIEHHPYWYARVIGIFHAHIRHTGPLSTSPEPQQVEFLWVRWFGRDLSYPAGWAMCHLHRIGFLPDFDGGAFGFLDPANVVRGVHLIPAFAHGTTAEYLGLSIARQHLDKKLPDNEDYVYFYVNM